MPSHYIQVGKLKIDQDLMNLICPAAGFTPENICPANGYILDPGAPYVPPVDIGTPETEEIRLLCTNNSPGILAVRVTTSAAAKFYAEIYSSTGILIETTAQVSSNTVLTYYFPTTPAGALFIVKLKPVSGSITVFKVDNVTGYTRDWQILQSKFNTPNITTLTSAFESIKTIGSVIFDCTLNFLTKFDTMFRYSGILNFTFPDSLPELTTTVGMFYQSDIARMIWNSTATAPKLTTISTMLQLTKNAISASFPASLPELTNFSNLVRSSNIQTITLFIIAAKVTSLGYAFSDTPNLRGEVTLPEMPLCVSMGNPFNINGKITKVKFQGSMNATWANATGFIDVTREAVLLEEFEFPREMATWTNTTCFSVSPRISKIKLPDIITATALTAFVNTGLAVSGHNLKEVTGDFDNSLTVMFDVDWNYSGITVWNTPLMRCSRFRIGASSTSRAPATAVEIDWANSDFSLATIQLYCTLDATELNRIFTALPTVTSKTIYIKGNPGVAGCTPAIATAKGWTVNTTS